MTHSLTYNDMLGAYAPYPAPIRPYLLRAATHPIFSSLLTKSFMRVFIDILSRAPIADPYRPLKLRVDIVADKLDISTKTVTRAIRFLQNRGWLSHHASHDGRNHQGEFCAREFILGSELRQLLGLPTGVATKNDSAISTKNTNINTHRNSTSPHSPKTLSPPVETCTEFTSETEGADDLTMQPESLSAAFIEQGQVTEVRSNSSPVLLEMSEARGPHAEVAMDKTTTGTKMSHGLYIRVNKIFLKEASFKEEAFAIKNQHTNRETNADVTSENPMEANIGIITNNKLNGTSGTGNTTSLLPVKPKQPKLPEDLAEMASTLQLSPWGICALMRLAKQMNQRLQDVWQAKREQILNAQATGGRAYRYVQYLLQTGEDFSWRARQSMMPSQPASDKARSTVAPATTDISEKTNYGMYRNKCFTGHNGVLVSIQDDGSATFTSTTQSNAYIRPADMGQIYEAITAGKLWPSNG